MLLSRPTAIFQSSPSAHHEQLKRTTRRSSIRLNPRRRISQRRSLPNRRSLTTSYESDSYITITSVLTTLSLRRQHQPSSTIITMVAHGPAESTTTIRPVASAGDILTTRAASAIVASAAVPAVDAVAGQRRGIQRARGAV